MPITEENVYRLRGDLRKHNPLIGLSEITHLFIPAVYLTRLDNHAFWANKDDRDFALFCLYKCGCPKVSGTGITMSKEFVGDDQPSYGCWWNAYSNKFLMPLNELNPEEKKQMNIHDLARNLDITNKTELIVDISNNGQYFWIPDKHGEKTIDEACSIVTPMKKECLPSCSLKQICGKDYRVQVATPQQLSEKILIPLIDKSWGPLPKDKWDEMRNMCKEVGSSELEEFKRRINGKTIDIRSYAR